MTEETKAQKHEFEEKMKVHQEEREEAKAKRDQKKEEEDPEEQVDYIEKKVKDQIAQINEGLNRITDLKHDKAELEHHFNTLFELHRMLDEYLANIAFCLPAATYTSFRSMIDSLGEELKSQKESALPKKKFAFKNRPQKQEQDQSEKKETVKEEMKDILDVIDPERDLFIKKLRNETLIVSRAEYEGKDKVFIENIENCDIFLPFVMKALYIKNTYHSRVYAGYVTGASYIDTTNKSVYQVSSHQVRIHKANEVTFHLDCKSAPIIEDCSKLKFGPYMFVWPEKEQDAEESGFDEPHPEKWGEVVDFKWIKREQSPNWCKMDEEEIAALTLVHVPKPLPPKEPKKEEE